MQSEWLTHTINELLHNSAVFQSLLEPVNGELIHWRMAEDKWSLLEVVCHLYDEEREDFRYRLNHTLTNRAMPMPPITPQEWVSEREYQSQNFHEVLKAFLFERDESIRWLKSLQNPDWNLAYQHPKMGPLTAKMFLLNWLAHDYLHIRQITRIKYEFLKSKGETSLEYAGNW